MFSCLQILEAFLWFVLITLLNVTLIILTLSVSMLKVKIISVTFRSEERFSRNAETEIYTLSLHDALPIFGGFFMVRSYYPSECHADYFDFERIEAQSQNNQRDIQIGRAVQQECRDRDLHSFPTRRSSDLWRLFYGSFLLPF